MMDLAEHTEAYGAYHAAVSAVERGDVDMPPDEFAMLIEDRDKAERAMFAAWVENR
jgi:hypothetical protein